MNELRGIALALRDFVEVTGSSKGSLVIPDGGTLTYSVEHGFRLAADGEITDISEWVDYVGLVAA